MLKRALRSSMFTVLFLMVASTAMAAYSIRDDATGGDCTQIGSWDAATKTCALTGDLYLTGYPAVIMVDSDGITLDGNGHSITGGTYDVGIRLIGRTGVTIKNIVFRSFAQGIIGSYSSTNNTIAGNTFLYNWVSGITLYASSGNSVITDNTIIGSSYGIRLQGSYGNTLTHNVIRNSSQIGIFGEEARGNTLDGNAVSYGRNIGIWFRFNCNDNTFTGNTIAYNGRGIFLYSNSNGNTFTGNTISNNGTGLLIWGSGGNAAYQNNFIDNQHQTEISVSGNVFSIDAPAGGNYWSNYDTPTEGCNDLNHDGLCDVPYYLSGGIDYLPWTKPNGWLTPEVLIGGIVSAVENLVTEGILTGGEGTALSATLSTALRKFEADNATAACNALDAFINQVAARVNAGALTVEEGQALIDAATLDECQ